MARRTAAQWPLTREPKTTELICEQTLVVNSPQDFQCEKQ